MKNFSLIILLAAFITITGCKKDEPIAGNGPITITIDSRAGDEDLQLGANYVTSGGDTVSFTTFKFFISNVVLIKSDGSEYVVPKDSCYYLVSEDVAESKEFTINNVPGGDYAGVRFTIGVDSLKSVSDVSERTGALDIAGDAADMYWTWNSGYIFYKIEGRSPSAPFNAMMGDSLFFYHVGGFGGYSSATLNNLREAEVMYGGSPARTGAGKNPEMHIYADVLEVFQTPTSFSIKDHPGVMFEPFSSTIADNYKDMFTIDHIHN